MDPDQDSDPAIFEINLQDANKQLIFLEVFCLLLFEGTFTSFLKINSQKEVTKKSESRFYYFRSMIEVPDPYV